MTNGMDAVVYPGDQVYNQLAELAPDEEIEHPTTIEHPDVTFEDTLDDGYEQAMAKHAESTAWLRGLLRTLPGVKFEKQVTGGFDPTEYITLAIGDYQIRTFFDDVYSVLPNSEARQLKKGTEEYTVAMAILDAAHANYDADHDYSQDPMGDPESYR